MGGTTLADAFPHAKFIFPTAPLRRATVYGRAPTHQWFDNWTLDRPLHRQQLQIDGLREISTFVHGILEREVAAVGAENVILGGLSQGCATALISLLTWRGTQLPAVFGMCGWLPFKTLLEESIKHGDNPGLDDDDEADGFTFGCSDDESNDDVTDNIPRADGEDHGDRAAVEAIADLHELLDMPLTLSSCAAFRRTSIFLGHGTGDEKVPTQLGREAAKCLTKICDRVEWKEYAGLEHWYSPEMVADIISFIREETGW